MANDGIISEAVEAIRQGQRSRARDLLTRLLRADKENPTYWLWMSAVVDSRKERIFCLETALRLDPKNQAARRGLILSGGTPDDITVQPAPLIPRRWEAEVVNKQAPPCQGLQKVLAHPLLRLLAFLFMATLIVILIAIGAVASRPKPQAIAAITSTSKPDWTFTPTNTSLPTGTLVVRTPTPQFHGPTPLWMLLEATYTPTPLYINTPHPITEAYSAGLRALAHGNWSSMLSFMLQASTVDPNSVDTRYYVGEAFRMLGQFDQALQAYELAIMLNPSFAPAYLGRARAVLGLDQQADVGNDLQRAIDNDPNLVEAYLERAAFFVRHNQPEAALQDLQEVEKLQPTSPLLYAWRAAAELQLGQSENAIQDASLAHELDFTLLLAYKLLGQAYLESGNFESAREFLQTYLLYEDRESSAWLLLGQTVFREGLNYMAAIGYFDQALSLAPKMTSAYVYRGLSYLKLEQPQQAVNDFVAAQKLDPESFEVCAYLGQALYEAGRQNEALRQLNSCEGLVQSDHDSGTLYYWRAMALESTGNLKAAGQDWTAFLALPEEAIPQEWLPVAREHYLAIFPAAITPTYTLTSQSTSTVTPTSTQPSRRQPPQP